MVGGSSQRPDSIRPHHWKRRPPMDYFAGLDVSMAETHICVVTRTGAVIHKAKVPSTPTDIAAELAQLPACRRILFETGRMAPVLFHGLSQLGLPVVCVESRQAYQALKSLATLLYEAATSCWPATRASSNSRTGPSRSPSDQRCAKRGLLWLAAWRSSCTRCCETGRSSHRPSPPQSTRQEAESSSQEERRPGREQTTAWILLQRPTTGRLRFQPSRPAPSLPHQVPNEHAENTGTRKRRHP